MSNDDKLFCGSGKKVEFNNGGSILKMTINVDQLMQAIDQGHGFKGRESGVQYIKVEAKRKREADQHGNTHYLEVDTWKPEQQPQQNWGNRGGYADQHKPAQQDQGARFEDDIPF